MGLFDQIFRPNRERDEVARAGHTFQTLTAYRPHFTTWSGAIYESDLVRAAIDARARHISKLKVETIGTAKPSLQAHLRQGPNQWQTWSQFLYRASTILDIYTTAVIVPVKDEFMQTTGYYTVLPRKCDVVEYEGEPWLRYEFRRGELAAVRMDECAILTRFQHKSDFFGGGNHALDETMKLVHLQNEGITEAVKSSATYRFMGTLNNFSTADDLQNEASRFVEKNIKGNDGPLLLFPNTYTNIKQIDSKPYTVDSDQMQLIRTNVAEYFGVNEKVMENTATADELDAFFNGAIEPFAIQFSEAMTKAMFTERERSQGSYLLANANRLQYMSVSQKVQMAKELMDRGVMTINEARELFNYPAVEDGDVRFIRGEYADTDDKVSGTEEGTDEQQER